ncbi:MAG: DEAD/DEAH box helicase family protein, partial [Chloroflexota bacterium]|nr:DEAD/DEAH box helicase family protein [Chloroflexota bacterium]
MATMKLRFDDSLEYQHDAINAVCDVYEGLPTGNPVFSISYNTGLGFKVSELGIANPDLPQDEMILGNVQRVQERNGITKISALPLREFAIEMETGTGKTYVYLRTAFELNKRYGFRKFVIVVPSIAIREGVLHSIETMRDHFRTLFGTPFDAFVYDGKQSNQLRGFAMANAMQIMVINIQAFQRDFKDEAGPRRGGGNVIYREQDRLNGWRPIDFLQQTRPFVIVDEPQKVQGTASHVALTRLNPCSLVQYSATFDSPTKLYRLGPIEAHQQRLVKQIEVASVLEQLDGNNAYVRLLKVDIAKQRVQLEINIGQGDAVARKPVWVKQRSDLYELSKHRLEYQDRWVVDDLSFDPVDGYVDFDNGQAVTLGASTGGLDDEVMRAQVHETVREHLEKELRLTSQGIKVLSLFFIDRVANYRQYGEDGAESLGKIGQWFEESYRELTSKGRFASLGVDDVGAIHDGYFSVDKKGRVKDTTGKTADDESTYDRIMRNKERLLSFSDPLRFIFSHSALREGWDNPNVFQICTLKETKSIDNKRQELGRGLRLP